MRDPQICTRCVMDTTAAEITFDEHGVCSFCHRFDADIKPVIDRNQSEGSNPLLDRVVLAIRASGDGKKHDSVLGLSGGPDSCYLAYMAVKLGLRPLVVHIDTGWDSPESESNVRNLTDRLGLDLEVLTVDWEEMRDLQLAFYRASVQNCEIPQDHVCMAALNQLAAEHDLHCILSGGNLATESVLPRSWGFNSSDLRHLLAINRRFGTRELRKLPRLSFWAHYVYYPFMKGIREVRLLDFLPYSREEAKRSLEEACGWQDYGAKHYESVLTRFYQGYYLPTKFAIDKRRAHLSSLILSGQMMREHAVEEMAKPPYPSEALLERDKKHIADKFGFSLREWEEILSLPPRKHDEFPSSKRLYAMKSAFARVSGIRRRRYAGLWARRGEGSD